MAIQETNLDYTPRDTQSNEKCHHSHDAFQQEFKSFSPNLRNAELLRGIQTITNEHPR